MINTKGGPYMVSVWMPMLEPYKPKNSGYIDYLDANYVPAQNKPSNPPAKPNAFHNFPQRTDYDYDDLEQRFINKANEITREDAK